MPTVQSGATIIQKKDKHVSSRPAGPTHGVASAATEKEKGRSDLAEYQSIRAEVGRLGEIVSSVAQARAEAAAKVVANGAQISRHIIRRNPWGALLGASAAGALLALAITPRAEAPSGARRLGMRRALRRGWANFPMATNAVLADIGPYLSSVRLPSAPSLQSMSLGDRVERLGDVIAGLDTKSAAEPLLSTVREIGKAVSNFRNPPV